MTSQTEPPKSQSYVVGRLEVAGATPTAMLVGWTANTEKEPSCEKLWKVSKLAKF